MEKQKWILVTGADRGLGLAFCEEFLNRGYYVIGAGHREDSPALEELRKQWGEKMCPIVLDVASCASVAHSVEQVRKYTDALWLLVSNAGMGNHGPDIRKGVCPEDNYVPGQCTGGLLDNGGISSNASKGRKKTCLYLFRSGKCGGGTQGRYFWLLYVQNGLKSRSPRIS